MLKDFYGIFVQRHQRYTNYTSFKTENIDFGGYLNAVWTGQILWGPSHPAQAEKH